jgi:acyl dehydratase
VSAAPEPLAVGDAPPPRVVGPLSVADFVRYAGAAGDFNPLHYDEAIARAAGFESVFAQGMFSAGVLASFAADWLGADAVRRFQVRFVEVVYPGDTLTCAATVVRCYGDGDGGERRADLVLTCTRQTGALAVRGEATFVVASHSD